MRARANDKVSKTTELIYSYKYDALYTFAVDMLRVPKKEFVKMILERVGE
jgi:hypothetical protein